MDPKIQVECYWGGKADERPVRFRLYRDEYVVEEVLKPWYGPEHQYFLVRADDGNVSMLRHRTSVPDAEWELVSLPQAGDPR